MYTDVSVKGSGFSWSIGLVLMSRPKPRKRYCVSNSRMSEHSQTPLFTMRVTLRERAGSDGHSPATVLGLQHLTVGGDTHLDRRLGWSLDGRSMVGGLTGVILTMNHRSGSRTVPTGGQPRLPWREYRASAFSYGTSGNRVDMEAHPLLP
jgi:hypothetical protein